MWPGILGEFLAKVIVLLLAPHRLGVMIVLESLDHTIEVGPGPDQHAGVEDLVRASPDIKVPGFPSLGNLVLVRAKLNVSERVIDIAETSRSGAVTGGSEM